MSGFGPDQVLETTPASPTAHSISASGEKSKDVFQHAEDVFDLRLFGKKKEAASHRVTAPGFYFVVEVQ
jgi:hypothetical protein